MIPGFTDAKYFTQMGARWYGFSPVKIEKGSGIRFADMFHGHDERVPVAGLAWGVEVLDAVVREISGVRLQPASFTATSSETRRSSRRLARIDRSGHRSVLEHASEPREEIRAMLPARCVSQPMALVNNAG